MVSPAAVVEQISISEEEEAAARSQQLREDEALARRLQVEDDSDIGTCRRYTHLYESHCCFSFSVSDGCW